MRSEPRPEVAEFAVLRVRLTPKGGRNALIKWEGDVLYARVSAPPVDGAANKALFVLLSDLLGIPKSQLSFQSGETSRDKVIRITGLNRDLLAARIVSGLPH